MRAVDFTRVTLFKFVPDALSVLRPEARTQCKKTPQTLTPPLASPAPKARTVAVCGAKALPVAALECPWRRALGAATSDSAECCTQAATAARFVPALRFMCVSSVSFVALQLYWLSLFVRISAAQRKRDQSKAKRAAKGKPASPEESSEEDA